MTFSEFKSEDISRFMAAVEAPAFLEPWLDRFYEADDLRLVLAIVAAGEETGGPGEGEREGVALSRLRDRPEVADLSGATVRRAYRRAVVDLLREEGAEEGQGAEEGPGDVLAPADFHARYEIWAIFEGWKDVPGEVRRRLNEWERAAYRERKRAQIAARLEGRDEGHLENEEYLLLDEAKALIDRVEHVYLWPCNCRAMEGNCDKPVNVCLRFTNNRDVGWEISRERAKEVLEEANRAGLMHTGEVLVSEGKIRGAICNCCADCCFPHQVAEELGAQKVWPRSRYVARWDEEACRACGRCARRCPFGAFQAEKTAEGRVITFAPEVCRGCGVCVVTCPDEAISMEPLEATAEGRDEARRTPGERSGGSGEGEAA